MEEIFTFRKLITPPIIKTLFWVVAIGIVVVGFVHVLGLSSTSGVSGTGGILYAFAGLLGVVLAVLSLRIYCEIILIFFFIRESLLEVRDSIDAIGESLKETKTILKKISDS